MSVISVSLVVFCMNFSVFDSSSISPTAVSTTSIQSTSGTIIYFEVNFIVVFVILKHFEGLFVDFVTFVELYMPGEKLYNLKIEGVVTSS